MEGTLVCYEAKRVSLIRPRYLNSTSSSGYQPFRLGLIRKNFLDEADGRMVEPETCIKDVESGMNSTIAILRTELGAEIIDVDMDLDPKDILEFEETAFDLLTMGMSEDMDIYLADLAESPVRNLKDLVMWNDAHSVSQDRYPRDFIAEVDPS
jgi:amidase